MEKTVLVTGASGYLGISLCRALLHRGYRVRAFVRHTSDLSSLPKTTNLQLSYGDITDYSALLSASFGCQFIIHSAALVEPSFPDPSQFFNVNVGGLQNVIRVCKETTTIERIIFTSSITALGPTTDGFVGDENQVHQEKFFCNEYEKSKVAAEKVVFKAVSEGVPIITVYPGFIYGPGKFSSTNAVSKVIHDRLNGRLPGYFGNGRDMFPYCYIEDVAKGHILAMEKGRDGERYLLTGENASLNHILDITAILTNTDKPKFKIPLSLIIAIGWVLVFVSRIIRRPPLFHPLGVYMLRHQWAYSCEKAKKELGYNPRSLNDGIQDLLIWMKSEGFISY